MRKQTQPKEKKTRAAVSRLIYLFPMLLLCSLLLIGASGRAIPDVFYAESVTSSGTSDGVSAALSEAAYSQPRSESKDSSDQYTAKLFGIIPAKTVEKNVPQDLRLVPCGDVFGVKFFTKGVVITDLSEVESSEGIICPAGKAGLKKGDVIISINGDEVNTAEDMGKHISSSDGKELDVGFTRDGKNYRAKVRPIKALADDMYKAGMWVRDSTAGIGTVTFYDPSDGSFAGLGHGIYDSDTEQLLPLLRGAVVDITLEDIIKGREGHPGELKGAFGTEKIGSLVGNTTCGVYGVMTTPPETIYKPIPCAIKSEVQPGKATILSNVDGRGVKEYDIEIVKIYSGEEITKNFVIEVRDDKLAELTGGIVRGMSGSPIIQNGKLVGAVTHVLVNEPMRGYGIFIENMLAEADKIE